MRRTGRSHRTLPTRRHHWPGAQTAPAGRPDTPDAMHGAVDGSGAGKQHNRPQMGFRSHPSRGGQERLQRWTFPLIFFLLLPHPSIQLEDWAVVAAAAVGGGEWRGIMFGPPIRIHAHPNLPLPRHCTTATYQPTDRREPLGETTCPVGVLFFTEATDPPPPPSPWPIAQATPSLASGPARLRKQQTRADRTGGGDSRKKVGLRGPIPSTTTPRPPRW